MRGHSQVKEEIKRLKCQRVYSPWAQVSLRSNYNLTTSTQRTCAANDDLIKAVRLLEQKHLIIINNHSLRNSKVRTRGQTASESMKLTHTLMHAYIKNERRNRHQDIKK